MVKYSGKSGPPDVLEHADADDLIEGHSGREIAVVIEDDTHAVAEARCGGTRSWPLPPAGH